MKPLLISILLLWLVPGVYSEQELSPLTVPPLIGLVTKDRVNLRARPSISSEVLFQFSKGTKLLVTGKEGSWYRIQLPPEVPVYVAKSFLILEDTKGRVRGKRVHVRAGAGQAFASVGLLSDQEVVEVRQVLRDWVKIQPTASCQGWINQMYVTFLERSPLDGDHRGISSTSAEGSQGNGSQGASER